MNLQNQPTGRLIGMVSNTLRRLLDKKLSDVPYGSTELACIGFIVNSNKENPDQMIFQRDIEKEFYLRSPTASEMIKNLEQKELITRKSVKNDGRKKQIILTEKGFSCDSQVKNRLDEINKIITNGISEEELKIFNQVTEKIIANIQREEING